MNKWELYNKNFEKTNETINENDEILEGKYHWTINTFIINSKKQVLLIKRSLNYNLHYPGFWNTINGNILSGQNADETVISSIYNKIGIKVQKDEIKSIDKQLRDPYKYIYETFIVNKDINYLLMLSKRIEIYDNYYLKYKNLKEYVNEYKTFRYITKILRIYKF